MALKTKANVPQDAVEIVNDEEVVEQKTKIPIYETEKVFYIKNGQLHSLYDTVDISTRARAMARPSQAYVLLISKGIDILPFKIYYYILYPFLFIYSTNINRYNSVFTYKIRHNNDRIVKKEKLFSIYNNCAAEKSKRPQDKPAAFCRLWSNYR